MSENPVCHVGLRQTCSRLAVQAPLPPLAKKSELDIYLEIARVEALVDIAVSSDDATVAVADALQSLPALCIARLFRHFATRHIV